TAKYLADTIKSICQEWNVSDKILLAVTDNGANIKSAIERELVWKHFPCYTHTLNLAVSDVLKSQEIAEILNKMKGIILHPCEEVTRELSSQKYITGSLVIPITVGLIKALEQLGEQHVFMSDIDKIRQDLIGNIKRRFYNLNNSKTFGNCMFLDPRFKFYFDDPHVAEETKRRMVSLVAAQHSRDAVTTNNITINIEEVEPTSCPRPIKSIWQDFERRMQGIQPEGTAQSRAIVEVQRYYDDKIINRNECPLKWWREHKSVYPTLYKIAATKLNAMASSVPCERVFSAAGNILNERRTRLGVRKLQQLLFLNQNL
ncbi:hypothetical protein SFRURICE_003828, partial [Spodoptera frugiperda]